MIAATAVAAGGAGVYAASSGDDAERASSRPVLQVRPVAFTRTASGPAVRYTGRVPRLTGLPAGLQSKVNALIRKPVDDWVQYAGPGLASFTTKDDPAHPYTGHIAYDVGLGGPKLFSVRYTLTGTVMSRNTSPLGTVTVDLTTGRALANRDFFRPAARTRTGASALTRLLTEYGPNGGSLCKYEPVLGPEDLTPEDLDDGVILIPTRKGIDFYLPLPSLGYPMICGRADHAFRVPYKRLGTFVRPEIFRAAGAPVPSPTASP